MLKTNEDQDGRLITADNDKQISTVGFICGDGGKYWN